MVDIDIIIDCCAIGGYTYNTYMICDMEFAEIPEDGFSPRQGWNFFFILFNTVEMFFYANEGL